MSSPFRIIYWHIYLLQLENYALDRFFRKAISDWNVPHTFRKKVIWTKKLSLVVSLAALLAIFLAVFLSTSLFPEGTVRLLSAVLLLFVFSYTFFLFLAAVTFVFLPVDRIVKQNVVRQARKKIQSMSDLKVVAITGSYGKTTMRHVVSEILGEGKRVVSTKENFNTPLGISRQILSELDHDTEVYVVEMGAYTRGDIAYLCSIAKPDVAILTGINEAHLERQGSIENIIKTKFEIVGGAKDGALIVLNGEDARVREHAKSYIKKSQRVEWYGTEGNDLWAHVKDVRFDIEKPGVSFSLEQSGKEESYHTHYLARYIVGVVMAARIVAEYFNVPPALVRERVSRLAPVEHRLFPIRTSSGALIIDDAYNGNPDGVREALAVLRKFEGQRRIVVTPGLVEMGVKMEEVHRDIARDLTQSADKVLLIETPASRVIHKMLGELGFKDVSMHERAEDAHKEVREILRKDDVVLFQNDVAENYQ